MSSVELGQVLSSAVEGLSLALVSFLGWVVQDFLLLGGHVDHEVHSPAVAIFLVMPGNDLSRDVSESNASPSTTGGRVGATVKVAGDNLVLTQSSPGIL